MSNISHTPGPWKTNDAIVYVEGEEEDFAICHTQSLQTNAISNYETCCANARLIAAAPELLEALRLASDRIGYLSEGFSPDVDPNVLVTKWQADIAEVLRKIQP